MHIMLIVFYNTVMVFNDFSYVLVFIRNGLLLNEIYRTLDNETIFFFWIVYIAGTLMAFNRKYATMINAL